MSAVALRETFMHMLPLTAGVVLIGGAMAGSMLRPATRAAIERWLIWPGLFLGATAYAIVSVVAGDTGRAAIGVLAAAMAVFYLVRNIKRRRAGKAPTNPMGTGTTA